tara:strand:+ start:1339 stop:2541 length:1203 start_codon:yes stop_codon:yes gene_type:complete
MSGLLDIWRDWRSGAYAPKGYEWGSQETNVDFGSSFPARTNLDTAGGSTYQGTKQKRGKFTTDPKYIRDQKRITTPRGRVVKQEGTPINAPGHVSHPMMNKTFPVPVQDAGKTPNLYKDKIMQGGTGINTQNTEQLGFLQKLSNFIGTDYDKAVATWKEKGGFEGLMANPAFTMGLAFMQAGAEGKTLGQGALDNVMKAGGISQHYKRIIEDRKQEPIQATAADIAEVEDILKTINIEEGNWLENLVSKAKGGNPGAEWSAAVEEIAVQFQAEIQKWQAKNKKADGTPKIIRIEDKIKIMNKLVKSGKIKKKKSWFGQFTADTLSKAIPMAEGGPVEAGKPYVVGEEGPEIIIPRSDGNVLSNDDSQIYAMLLASNPQLQKVSRARAEKILRARFPEYFE